MDNDTDRDIYNKLQKLYEEMGWFQPFPLFEELFGNKNAQSKDISESKKLKRDSKRKYGRKGRKRKDKKNGKNKSD